MDPDVLTAIIFVGGGIIGSILVTQLWSYNWFKKENYKLQRDLAKKKGMIDLKKMEMDLGIKPARSRSGSDKGISPDLVKDLIGQYLEGSDEEESGLAGILKSIVAKNPELVEGFLKGLQQGKTEERDIYEMGA